MYHSNNFFQHGSEIIHERAVAERKKSNVGESDGCDGAGTKSGGGDGERWKEKKRVHGCKNEGGD